MADRFRSPLRVLVDWTYDCYSAYEDHGEPRDTWRSNVAHLLLWKWHVACAIGRCLFARGHDDLIAQDWWARPLYRSKAIICLLLGRHLSDQGGREYWRHLCDSLQLFWWNGAMTGYYEPEWQEDSLHVGYGWRNWYVQLEASHEERS